MQELDLYQILQVVPEAEPEVIQAAYRALVKKYHPDTGYISASNEIMQGLNQAFGVLSDPDRRRAYNSRRFKHQRPEPVVNRQPAPAQKEEMLLCPVSGVEIRLVHIPAGVFLMGRNGSGPTTATRYDSPQHQVSLAEYYLGKYPITVTQFDAFVHATGYQTTAEQEGNALVWIGNQWVTMADATWQHPRGPWTGVQQKQDHPVTVISWDDAEAFCAWASQETGRIVRLPTEAEWEKAARGTDGRLWPWSNEPLSVMHLGALTDLQESEPVGYYSPTSDSIYGCADMIGRVCQWTHSLPQGYPYRADDGREDSISYSAPRVMRGGPVWLHSPDACASHREAKYPTFRASITSLRICVTLE